MTPRNRRQSTARPADPGTVGAMTKRAAPADALHGAGLATSQPELTSGADPFPAELPELMTSAEVAAALRLSAYVVREYVRTGVLPAYRVGRELRIARSDVARHLASLRIAR